MGTPLPAPSSKANGAACWNCLHMYEKANTDVQNQLYTDKTMTMLPHFNI